MSIPIIWHQDASKTWVTIEDNSKHVVGLALMPIVSAIDLNE
jgi:hypothetical protein